MLISVHIPKTAGSSFAKSLNDHFGSKLYLDYSDLPLHKSNFTRNSQAFNQHLGNHFKTYRDIKAIHGHFLPYKYLSLSKREKCTYITWLRDPAERIASQYYYMKRHYTPEKAAKQPLLKRIIEEEWSLEKFCLSKELQNTYSMFFWHFPVSKFQFIGIIDNYQNDLQYFSKKYLNTTMHVHNQNINPLLEKSSYFEESSFKKQVLEFHAKDNLIYKEALKQSNNRKD